MKVAIAGYGQEGDANYRYWSSLGADVEIFDEKEPSWQPPENAKLYVGTDAFFLMNDFDLVVRTAGLNPNKIHTNSKVWSATNEFFEKCPAPIIGVTGTKGKGTTCSLIAEILKTAGKTVHLVGNIGVSALDVLPEVAVDDLVVFELSSFQLWDLKKSPETAVVLMIEPDHQDIHASMAEYVEAKANIAKFQHADDLLIYHPTNAFSAEVASKSSAQKKQYQSPEGACVRGQDIVIDGNVICSKSEVGLIGPHNLDNICAAITASWNYTQDIVAIKQAVIRFKGLPHRLEFVREVDGVKYYNDSFSAAPGAAVAAMQAFEVPEIFICGGYSRGLDFTELAKAFARQKNVKKVVLIGQTRNSIAEALAKNNFDMTAVTEAADLNEAVSMCKSSAAAGDVVVLSPGCPSFDMFKNFYDRGDQFKRIVEEL